MKTDNLSLTEGDRIWFGNVTPVHTFTLFNGLAPELAAWKPSPGLVGTTATMRIRNWVSEKGPFYKPVEKTVQFEKDSVILFDENNKRVREIKRREDR